MKNSSGFFFFFVVFLASCQEPPVDPISKIKNTTTLPLSSVDSLYHIYDRVTPTSESQGKVSNGKLINGVPFPFSGDNFTYFDTVSYLRKRAFVNSKVREIVLNVYADLFTTQPSIKFGLMECSNEHGGEIWPHRTHQNGLSIDFMSPLKSNGIQSLKYNTLGPNHYFMQFDSQGRYAEDSTHSIDFELIAQHILALNAEATKKGMRIAKVIFKLDLLDELFASPSGKELKNSGIYFARHLDPLINALHDDHYHIDFEILSQ